MIGSALTPDCWMPSQRSWRRRIARPVSSRQNAIEVSPRKVTASPAPSTQDWNPVPRRSSSGAVFCSGRPAATARRSRAGPGAQPRRVGRWRRARLPLPARARCTRSRKLGSTESHLPRLVVSTRSRAPFASEARCARTGSTGGGPWTIDQSPEKRSTVPASCATMARRGATLSPPPSGFVTPATSQTPDGRLSSTGHRDGRGNYCCAGIALGMPDGGLFGPPAIFSRRWVARGAGAGERGAIPPTARRSVRLCDCGAGSSRRASERSCSGRADCCRYNCNR